MRISSVFLEATYFIWFVREVGTRVEGGVGAVWGVWAGLGEVVWGRGWNWGRADSRSLCFRCFLLGRSSRVFLGCFGSIPGEWGCRFELVGSRRLGVGSYWGRAVIFSYNFSYSSALLLDYNKLFMSVSAIMHLSNSNTPKCTHKQKFILVPNKSPPNS